MNILSILSNATLKSHKQAGQAKRRSMTSAKAKAKARKVR